MNEAKSSLKNIKPEDFIGFTGNVKEFVSKINSDIKKREERTLAKDEVFILSESDDSDFMNYTIKNLDVYGKENNDFYNLDFMNATIEKGIITNSTLHRISFMNAIIGDLEVENVEFFNGCFMNAFLVNCIFKDVSFNSINLQNAVFLRCSFVNCSIDKSANVNNCQFINSKKNLQITNI